MPVNNPLSILHHENIGIIQLKYKIQKIVHSILILIKYYIFNVFFDDTLTSNNIHAQGNVSTNLSFIFDRPII